MRQRGNQYRAHMAETAPHVLDFKAELVVDGRLFERPVNYCLVRIVPPPGIEIDMRQRPFVIVDPRAGHGPGIGGFKADSEIGVALKAGHPCYFIGFLPEPMPGQTIEDVARAEALFRGGRPRVGNQPRALSHLHAAGRAGAGQSGSGRSDATIPSAKAAVRALSNANPAVRPLARWAEWVREHRRPAAADNPFIAIQEGVSQQIVAGLDAWREFNETHAERAFMAIYGSKALQAAVGVDPVAMLPPRKATKSLLQYELVEKRVADICARISSGGLREALVRALLFAGMERAAVDERGFEAVRRIRQSLSDVPLSTFKATVREQYDMLLLDTEGAVAAIPSMLPEDATTRQRAFDLICEVLQARGKPSSEDQKRMQRIGGLFQLGGRLSANANLAIASDSRNEPPARAS